MYSKDCNNNYSAGVEKSETTGSLSNPTNLTAVATSCSIDITWSLSGTNDVLLLSNTSSSFGTPVTGTSYSVGQSIGTATVISVGSLTSKTESPLDNGITKYYKAFSYDASHNYSSGTAVKNATTLNVDNTSAITSSSTLSSITLNWVQNIASDDVIVLWNTTNTFGSLVDATTYTTGAAIAGGGTVLDQGNLITKTHSGLSVASTYYYKVYSMDCNKNYSSGVEKSETTGSLSNPTALAAVATSCSINVTWNLAGGNDVLLLSNTTNNFGTPVSGTSYNLGDAVGTATVISIGSLTTKTESPLDNGITKYYKAFSYDASNNYSSGTAVESATTTNVVNPTLSASTSTETSTTLNFVQNTSSDNVIVLWNTTNTFGNLTDGLTYANGISIVGGGTVIDQGNYTSVLHSGLTASTTYYYKVYSLDCNHNYSVGVAESITTSASAAVADPQSFSATSSGISSIDLAWVLNAAGDNVIIVRNTTGVFVPPIDGFTLNVGNTFITDYVVYKGTGSSYTDDDNGGGLDQGTTYYYKAYSVNASDIYSLGITDDATTDVVVDPLLFSITSATSSKVNLSWTANPLGDSVMIIYNTVNVFTQPVDGTPYSVGGTVIYRGLGNTVSSFEHTGLNSSTKYYYKIWSYDNSLNYYSTPGKHDTITTMAPGIATLPHITNFDLEITTVGTPTCGGTHNLVMDWQNVTGDDVDWAPRIGTTNSPNTGPNYDHTQGAGGSGGYLFTEASSPCFNKTSWLVSPLYNFVGLTNPRIEFYYHMYGASMGTLSVQASNDGGTTWSSNLFTKTGQQHVNNSAAYSHADINLSAYAGMSNIKLRITGLTGGGYTSDMAIDDIKVYQPQNMVITSVTVEQDSDPVVLGDNTQGIIRVKVLTNGAFSPLSITQLNFGTNGTTQLTDVENAKVYYTGSNPNFSAAQTYGNTVAVPAATFQINSSKVLLDGVNYLWLTYDIKSTATINNFVDASCSQVTIGGVAYTPTVTSPPETKKIIGVVTIEGTTSVTSDGPVFRPNYTGAYEMVYLASEMGTTPKELTRIEFHKNSGSDIINEIPIINIFIKNSSASTLSSGTYSDGGDYVNVYTGPMPNNITSGWIGVDFLNSFLYNGTDNIHILVTQVDNNVNWWDYAVYSHHSTAPSTRKRANSNWNGGVTNLTASTARANVKLQYETPAPMTYVSSTTSHPNVSNLGVGSTGEEIIRVEVVTANTASALSLTKMNLNITGTTSAADLSKARVYYTGSSSNFAAINQFGAEKSNPNGSYAVTDGQTLISGTNYFWVVYDISSSATIDNVVDAVCESIIVGGVSKTPSITAPAGNRKIKEYITIGTGTSTSNLHPLTDYPYHKWEGIYLSSELGGAKDISALAFYKASGNNTTNDITGVTIYMKHTTASSLTTGNATNVGYGSAVFTGNFPNTDTTGWMEVPFTSTFAYNGTDNISVYIEQTRGSFFNMAPYWSYSTTTSTRARYAENFSAFPTNLPATNRLANIRFEYNTPTDMSYVSSEVIQNNFSTITSGVVDQEIIGVTIEMLNSANPLNATSFTFNTAGSNSPISDISNATVYYTSTSNNFAATNQFGSVVANPNGSFTVIGSQALTLGTNYFWLAYDVPASATNGNGVDAQCSNIKIGTTNYTPSVTDPIGSRTIQSALSGYYTIGTTGDYPTFNTAVTALNTLGVSGWVTFQVQNGTYTEKVTLNAVANASATNVITFESLSGDSNDVTLQFASSSFNDAATLLFGSGDHFVFRNMTIKGTGSNYAHAVELSASNTGTNVIRNCILSVSATSTSSSAAVIYSSGLGISNLRVVNNKIIAYGYGIYLRGNFSANASGVEIDSNIITTNRYGAYLNYLTDMKFRGNTITANTGSSNFRGLYINSVDGPTQISENNIVSRGTSSYGIYFTGSDGTNTNKIDVYNNFISNITTSITTSIGIALQNSNYINLYFNNINILATNGNSRSGVYITNGSNITLRNNNIIASGGGYALNYGSGVSNISSNYNNLYTSGTNLGVINSSNRTNLAAWQTSSGGDANSLSIDPVYTSTTDLHINNALLNNAGISITGITKDIDGDARHATTPDIGADEMGSDLDAGIIAITDPTSPICTSGINVVKATIKNYGSTPLTSASINWKVNGASQSIVSWTGNLAQGATQNVTLGNFNFVLVTNDIDAWTSAPNTSIDQYTANDSSNNNIAVSSVPTVTVGNDTAICSTSYTTSNSVVSANATLLWTSTGTGVFNNGSSLIDTYNPSAADYTAGSVYLILSATNVCGSDKDSLLLTLSQPISVSFTGNAAQYCANAPVDTFYGTPAGGAFSGPGMSGNLFNPANANTGINTIKYIYTSGICSASSIQTIQVDPIPVVNLSGLNATYCDNDATVTLIGTPAGGAFGGNGVTGNIFDPTSTTIASPSQVWYSFSNGSCNSSDTQIVVVNTAPLANAGTDKNILILGNTTLDGSATGGTGSYSYSWTPTSRIASGANAATATTSSLVASENFTLLVTDNGNACTSEDDMSVTVGNPLLMIVSVTATPDTICLGESINLQSTLNGGIAPYTYSWTSNPVGYTSSATNPIITPTQSAWYKLVVNDNTTLSDEDSVYIVVEPLPIPSFTGLPAAMCSNDVSVTLVGTPTGGIFTGSGIVGNEFSPAALTVAGSYDIVYTVTNTNGCSNSDTNVVIVSTAPVAFAGNDANITSGTSTTLSGSASGGSGSYSYDWTPIASIASGGNTTTATTTTLTSATLFTLTVTDNASACSDDDKVLISVGPSSLAATVSATPDTICDGENSQLEITAAGGSGTYTYSWTSNPIGFTSSIANPIVNPSITTTYSVVVNDGVSTVNKSQTIIVNSLPNANAGTGYTIASGTSTILSGSASGGSGTYSYSWTPIAFIASGVNTATPTTTALTGNTTYTLSVMDGNNCSNTDDITIAVSSNVLTVTATSSPAAICVGGTSTVTAVPNGGSGTYTYSWTSIPAGYTNSGTDTIIVSPTTTTTYTVAVSDGTLNASSSDTVVVNAAPVANAGTDQNIVSGASATLTGLVTGGTSTYSYSWSPAANLVNPNIQNPATTPLTSTTTFTLTVNDLITGCTGTDDVIINVGNSLAVVATATPNPICSGESSQLLATANGGSGTYTYAWTSIPAGFTSNLVSPTINPLVSTVYSVVVFDGVNTVNNTVSVTVNQTPIANAGSDVSPPIFAGTSTTLNGSHTGGANIKYSWTPVASISGNSHIANPTTSILNLTTQYILEVQDSINGCSDQDTVIVNVQNAAFINVTVSASPDTICFGSSTQLSALATGVPPYIYTWSSVPVGFVSNIANPIASPTVTTVYRVVVQHALGDTDTAWQTVVVETAPTASFVGLSSDYCDDASSVNLLGTPAGGVFSGNGVSGSSFDPTATTVTIGSNQIIYTVSQNGCSDSDTQYVSVNETPIANAGTDITMGSGTAVLNGSYTGGLNVGYFWTPTAMLLQDDVASPSTVVLTSTQTYTLTTMDTINGCSSNDEVDVIISGGATTVFVNANPTTICDGDTSFITTTVGGGDGTYTYLWTSVPAGFTSTNADINVTPSVNTTYNVVVTSNGSVANGSITIIVNSIPNITFSGLNTPSCANGSSMTLSGSPIGGTFIGTGVSQVSGNYVFDPSVAGAGNWDVIYNYTNTTTACSNADTQYVSVNANPNVNVGIDDVVIIGNAASLSGSATDANNYLYAWTPSSMVVSPNTASTQTIALTASQIFTLTVTDSITSCSGNDDVQISVNNPVVPVSITANVTPSSICSGDTAYITSIATDGSGVYTYSWTSVPAGFTSTDQNPKVTPTVTTVYTVVVEDGSANNASASVTVNVKASPVVGLFGLDTINCSNGLKDTLQGYPIGGFYSGVGLSANVFDPMVAGNGYHIIQYSYTGSNGCTGFDTDTVHVYAAPTANAGPNYFITVPPSQTASLSGNATGGTGSYNYSWSPASLFTNANMQNVTTTNYLLYTTQFTLEVEDQASLCKATDDVVVTVKGGPLTVNPVASPDTICAGDPVQLTAYAGGGDTPYMYAWISNPSGFVDITANPVVNPMVTTTYTINIFDGTNTVSSDVVVVVDEIPNVSITTSMSLYCENGIDESIVAIPSGGIFYGNGMSSNIFSPSNAGTGSHQIIYEYQSPYGCISSDTVYAMVQVSPIADAGSDISIPCNGAGGLIGSNSVADKIYSWTPSIGLNQPTYSNTIANPTTNTLYTVLVTDTITTCTNTDDVMVTIIGGPTLNVSNDTMICKGAAVTLMASGSATSYLWSNGQSSGNITVAPVSSTVYSVTASDASLCTAVDSVTVTVNAPYVFLGPDIVVNDTNTVILDAGFGYVDYSWNTGSIEQAIEVEAFINAQLGLNKYVVQVTDLYGCKAKDSVMITYMLDINELYVNSNFNVYPNPSKGKFTIEIENDQAMDYELEIVNLQGKIIHNHKINAFSGIYTQKLDLSTLAKGVYLIRLFNDDYLSTKKLIIY